MRRRNGPAVNEGVKLRDSPEAKARIILGLPAGCGALLRQTAEGGSPHISHCSRDLEMALT
jgi:hypothetical protein